QFERLGLRGGGEGQEADVFGPGSSLHLGGEDGFGVDLSAVVEVGLLGGGEDLLQLGGGGAGLGGVRFVGDDGVTASGQGVVVVEQLEDGGEGLQGDHDDLLAAEEALMQQLGLG